jgi:hypothetical protein
VTWGQGSSSPASIIITETGFEDHNAQPSAMSIWEWNSDNLNVEVTFCYRDGEIHTAVTDFEDRMVLSLERAAYTHSHLKYNAEVELKELDVPSPLLEMLSTFGVAPFVPGNAIKSSPDIAADINIDLAGKEKSQVIALERSAAAFLKELGKTSITDFAMAPPFSPVHQPIIDKIQYMSEIECDQHPILCVAQVLFARKWHFDLRFDLRDFVGLGNIAACSEDWIGDVRPCHCLSQQCLAMANFLDSWECYLVYHITTETFRWVLQILKSKKLTKYADPNDRYTRLKVFTKSLDDSVLSKVFSVLSPAVDLEGMLHLPDWNRWLRVGLIRLADDILLFQIGQGSEFEMLSLSIFLNFEEIMSGRSVSRQVELESDMPVGEAYRKLQGKDV